MIDKKLAKWAMTYPFHPIDIDCVIAVMLKIIDGKCKMNAEEKIVMTKLYDQLGGENNKLLPQPETNDLINAARIDHSHEMKNRIYEQRVLAETMISRPVMKGFKAMLKREGIIGIHTN